MRSEDEHREQEPQDDEHRVKWRLGAGHGERGSTERAFVDAVVDLVRIDEQVQSTEILEMSLQMCGQGHVWFLDRARVLLLERRNSLRTNLGIEKPN